MPITINGRVYYRTLEASRETGISRSTLLRWLKEGIISEMHRDTRGWRLFTDEDLQQMREKASSVTVE
jgi:DNA-binding transcriptional MerR regulator